MQILALQTDIRWEDKAANIAALGEALTAARPEPGALVVLPEMYATGFSMKVPRVCEGDEAPAERALASLAATHRIVLQGGVVHRAADGRGLNQSVTFGPGGELLARYTKLHPFSFAGEHRHYAPGDALQLFGWGGMQVAPTICYDLRFPELFRCAVRRGAQLFTVIANWPARREAHWLALLTARAIENQAYVVGVNRCGNDPWLAYSGRSLIIGPRGDILADAGSTAGAITADADVEGLLAYRAEFPALADMRQELLPTRA